MELIPLSRALSQRELLDPIKPAYDRRRPDGRLKLAASAFHRLDRPASSPGNRAYCCAKLAVSSLAVTVTTANNHCAYPRKDGQAELAWVAGYIPPRWDTRPKTVTHPSTNRAPRRVTWLMRPTLLPLHQTTTVTVL